MKTYRINAVMTGALYFLGTLFGILSAVFGGEVLTSITGNKSIEGVEILSLAATNSNQLTVGAFFIILMGLSLAGMTVFLYPVIKKDSRELATGMLLFRGAFEGTGYILSTLSILALVILGNEYTSMKVHLPEMQSIGNVLYKFIDTISPITSLMFLIGATCLYVSFYRTKLIPVWLSLWGLIGVVPYFIYAILHFFHLDSGFGLYLQMILAPQEIIMGGWLVIKGFNNNELQKLIADNNNSC